MGCFRWSAALSILIGLGTTVALAQGGGLEIELNAAANVGDACRLTFVVSNNTPVGLGQSAFDVAAFDSSGVVSQFLVLEFGALPMAKTRVVQFDLPETACGDLSRLLVNDQRDCSGDDGAAADICLKSLAASSRLPDIRFGL